jgi:sugar lactone lactonase YvrE
MMRLLAASVCLVLWVGNAASAAAPRYKLDVLGEGSPMHGIQGVAFGPDGALYAASTAGRSLYRIDTITGAITTYVGPPEASADDLAFGPDGMVAWTNIVEGVVYARGKDGKVRALARDMPSVNAIAFTPSGRLFVTCVISQEGLYEIDPNGAQPPRMVLANIGRMNAFQFADEKFLYGPIMLKGTVVKINVDTGEMTDVAAGFKLPVSVRIERDGHLIVVDHQTSEVFRVDPATGEKTLIASFRSIIDNSAIAKDGTIYLSLTDNNGIVALNPKTLARRRVTWSEFSLPGFLTMVEKDGKERLLLADSSTPRFVDPDTGKVDTKVGMHLRSTLAIGMGRDVYAASLRRTLMTGANVQVLDRSTAKEVALLHDFGAPYDVKFIPDGFVVADFAAGQLVKVGSGPAYTRTILVDHLEGPVGLAEAGDGAFYVSEFTGGRISRVDTATDAKTSVIDGLKDPEGIALTPDNRLIVAEVGRKRVLAIDLATGRATPIAEGLAIGFEMDPRNPPPFLPTGVAVGRNGAIYVPSDLKNVLYRLTPLK